MHDLLPQATLAALMAQSVDDGADPLTLRALVEEACDIGTRRALSRLGLEDAQALADMHELRTLLGAIGWLVKLALFGLLLGVMVKLHLITLSAKF
jgi:hypothetical protein